MADEAERKPSKKRKRNTSGSAENATTAVTTSKASSAQCIIILDLASLEIVKTKKNEFTLLNGDDHRGIIAKHNRSGEECRPDICHQELMACMDSPLNKAGMLKVYVRTRRNVLIDVHPTTRVPRTYKRFAGLFCQLLHKLKVRAADSNQTLLKVIKNPVQSHLPPGTVCYGLSKNGTRYTPHHFAEALPKDKPVALIFGAMAAGSINPDDHDNMVELISISEYPLSGATAINRVLGAMEALWGVA